MKHLLFFVLIIAATLSGCHSHKTATSTQASAMNDTTAAAITASSGKNISKSGLSLLSSDSLGVHFSADSIKLGNVVIYSPEISTEAKGTSLRHESEEKAVSADSVNARLFTSSSSSDNRFSDVKQETSSAPSTGDLFQFAGFLVVLCIAFVMVRKFIVNKKK